MHKFNKEIEMQFDLLKTGLRNGFIQYFPQKIFQFSKT